MPSSHVPFFGPWVVRATFVMAMFGWGIGFYGPPIYLHEVVQRTGWSLELVSAAVTAHFLFGALVITRLPAAFNRYGVGPISVVGASFASLGVFGWSIADTPWQLLLSALMSGGGWVTMGAVAVNAAIAPWYDRQRPVALARAYNGASIGGVVFSPLWVWLIERRGFSAAAAVVGLIAILVMAAVAQWVYARTPQRLGQAADGEAALEAAAARPPASEPASIKKLVWRDRRFATLALGMSAGLFAQIGLLAHLFSLLVPALGAQGAGLALSLTTACAIAGRSVVARMLQHGVERRSVAACSYAVQMAGTLLLLCVDTTQIVAILLALVLFGSGIGNATSLPPLIVQVESRRDEVSRAVALMVAAAQSTYAFAPGIFGAVLGATGTGGAALSDGSWPFLAMVAAVQALAVGCFLAGRSEARSE